MKNFWLTLGLVGAVMTGVAATPESQGVDSQGILNWLDACERQIDSMHGFVLRRHGKVIAEGSWAPYSTLTQPHRLYSHSKSFTSTAIGLLVDTGKLDLDERVIDILPDLAPAQPSENLKQLRVRDLLTMNVGALHTDAEQDDSDGNWERAFLANKFDNPPGSGFRYDSGATYMLAVIAERRSGERLMDFLQPRLFAPLAITNAWSSVSPTGTACGGWGMNMTTRDIAKFGQLLLDRGVWQGQRLLSAEWIALASARQTWSGPILVTGQDGNDWNQGYGFQFWRTRHGAYRADGANGQFTVVLPEYDAVLSMHAGTDQTQRQLELAWQHLLPAMKAAPLPENPQLVQRLNQRCAQLALPPPAGVRTGAEKFCGHDFRFPTAGQKEYWRPGKVQIAGVRLDATANGWECALTTNHGTERFPVGFGEWQRGALDNLSWKCEILGCMFGRQPTAAAAAVQPDGSLKLRAWLTDGPQHLDLVFRDTAGELCVTGKLHGICGRELPLGR